MKNLLEYLSRDRVKIKPKKDKYDFIVFYKYQGEKYVSINVEWLYNNIESFKQYNYYYISGRATTMTSNLGNDIADCIEDNPAADYIVIKMDSKYRELKIIPLPEGEHPEDVERIPRSANILYTDDTMRGESNTDLCKNMIDRLGASRICTHV